MNNFVERAAAVKTAIKANKGKAVSRKDVTPLKAEGSDKALLSGKEIADAIVLDLKSASKELDMLRTSNPNAKAIDISLAQYVKQKYGFGSINSFYDTIGVDPSLHSVSSFATMPEFNENFRWLIPEVIREAIRTGLRRSPIYPMLIAAEETVAQPKVIMPAIQMSDAMAKKIGETETIPTGSVNFGQKTVSLTKLGTGIKISDEVNQYVSLNILSIYLEDVGIKMGIGLDNLAISAMINGDQADASEAAGTIGVDNTTNGFTYYDLLRIWIRMARIGRNATGMLSNENPALTILNLPEFKGFAGQATVPTKMVLKTPIPATSEYLIHGAMPANNQLMIFDAKSALIKLNSTALKVEAERIVERGLNATYVNMTTGFATMFRDSRVLLDKSVAFSVQGFPSFMDVGTLEAETFKS